jgi:hypothetical protein
MIPDMTTGINDYDSESVSNTSKAHGHSIFTFMIRSGLNVPTPAIPIPDFAVP